MAKQHAMLMHGNVLALAERSMYLELEMAGMDLAKVQRIEDRYEQLKRDVREVYEIVMADYERMEQFIALREKMQADGDIEKYTEALRNFRNDID